MASIERAKADAAPSTAATTASPAAASGTAAEGTGIRAGFVPSGHSAAEGSAEITEQEKFQITCLRNTHYHEDRERFFARWHKLTMFIVVLGGAATFAPLEQRYWVAASVVTIAGLIDLVFDVSGRARLHASLRRRIYELLAESQDADIDLSKLKKRAIDVYADEPPCMHAVNALAYNSAMEAFRRPRRYQLQISARQRLFRNFWPFPATDFKTFDEIAKAKAHLAA